jgi:acetyltransferase-like isoleucine patch superfamily enzyme
MWVEVMNKAALREYVPLPILNLRRVIMQFPIDFRDALIIGACKQPSHFIRNHTLKFFGMTIGEGSSIHMGCRIYFPWNIKIGEHSVVNPFCILDGRTGLIIGNNVSISERSVVLSLEHDPQSPNFAPQGGITKIGDYAWLGMNTTILPGVTIGVGSVIAAGAVVTKDVNDYEIVGGVPAKKIGMRTKDLRYILDYKKLFH